MQVTLRDHFMKRIYVNVTEEQHDALKARAAGFGSTVSDEIRRAVAQANELWKMAVERGCTPASVKAWRNKESPALLAYEPSRCSCCGSEYQKAIV
jgi:hypothetical protein